MRTKKTKESFINEMNKRIEMRKTIVEFYENVFIPTIALKFDGKVYNKRLFTYLDTEIKKISELAFVKQEYSWGELSICFRYDKWNYNDYEQLYCKLSFKDGNRIDYDATMNDKTAQNWLKSFKEYTNQYQSAIDHYNDYMKVAEHLENALNEYNKLPHTFRNNLETSFMHIY